MSVIIKKETCNLRQRIAEENRPDLFDRKINIYLKDHYIISLEEVEKNPSKFMKGYLADSVIRLNAEGLVMLEKWSEDTNVKLIFDQLKMKRIESLLKSSSFIKSSTGDKEASLITALKMLPRN